MSNKKIRVVVPISGGKDSQACLKLAIENYPSTEVIGLFCDTGYEHPLTYKHIDAMAEKYGVLIEKVGGVESVESKCLKYNRFPNGRVRFCTDELKIQPSKLFYKQLALVNGGFEVWCGVRSAESHARAKRYAGKVGEEVYPISDYMSKFPKYLDKMGVLVRLPIIDWSTSEVFDYLNGDQNPLYSHGFDRVGCFPCLASGDKHKEKAFAFDATGARHKEIAVRISTVTGQSLWNSKGGKERNDTKDNANGCSFCSI